VNRIPASPACLLPPQAGIGLKPQHYAAVLGECGDAPRPGWVEVHPQNYFVAGGPALRWLERIAADYALSFHSTGLSLGSATGPNPRELDALTVLCERFQPAQVSDHLSWSDAAGEAFPDLLPLPYTAAALARMSDSVARVQDALRRPILVENPSRYLAFAGDSMDEAAFLTELCRRTGCALLLDLNNLVVSATNLGLDAQAMAAAIAPGLIGEVHLAGHAIEDHGDFVLAIDDHGSRVGAECWALFERLVALAGPVPALVEWDTDVPDYATLIAEAQRADAIMARVEAGRAAAA
jgi:uncharacterized protein